ncbi:MAG: metallophosphatase family protein [Candidatus Dormibacteraeota bacterium]|nr:metallophosphatase family protein [Candidatus Dormibacteraeota bacterium]
MRLAILSDIHGNPIALDAVLADIDAGGGVDGYLVLGDLVALGYDPVGVLERLVALKGAAFLRGNTDRYVVTGDRPPPSVQDARQNPDLLPRLIEVANSFAWTQGYVAASGWLDWLAKLPLELRLNLPDKTRLLSVHASPGRDDGNGITPTTTIDLLQELVAGCEADLVCVGHTHLPLDRRVGMVRVVNVGSVSNPLTDDLRANYVLLAATHSEYQLQQRRVDYDHQAVIEAVRRSRHPAAEFLIGFHTPRHAVDFSH